jgi:hypothetical protein
MKQACLLALLLPGIAGPAWPQAPKCNCTLYPWPPACSGVCVTDVFNKASADDLEQKLKLSAEAAQKTVEARNKRQFSTTSDVRHALLSATSKRDLTEILKLSPSAAEAVARDRQTQGQLDEIDERIMHLAVELVGQKTRPEERPLQVETNNGIIITGGEVSNPTVNEFYAQTPPPQLVTLTYSTNVFLRYSSGVLRTRIEISTDGPISRPAFAVLCDRPILELQVQSSTGFIITGEAAADDIPSDARSRNFLRVFGVSLPDPITSDDKILADILTDTPVGCVALAQIVSGRKPAASRLQRSLDSSVPMCSHVFDNGHWVLPPEK